MGLRRFLAALIGLMVAGGALPAAASTERAVRSPAPHRPAHIHPADLPAGAERPLGPSPYRHRARSRRVARSAPSSVAGNAHVPVLLADFRDNPAERNLHTSEEFESMLFELGYDAGQGSLRDYYLDQSGGLFDVTGTVSPWLRMPRAYSDYVGARYGYQTSGTNAHTLVQDAVRAADDSIDFCRSDSDHNGLVDTMFVVHAGAGAEESGAGLWSIQWNLPTPFDTGDVCADGRRMRVQNYTIEPEEYAYSGYSAPGAPDRMVAIGMYVHEFGHVLGLPDLYDIDHSSPGGVGPYDVMATGAWGYDGSRPWRPAPMSAYSKVELGWAEPRNVGANLDAAMLPSADTGHQGVFDGIYRVAPQGSAEARQYFLVENRTRSGWASDFPAEGMLIWRVNEARRAVNNTDNANDSARLVELVQADGRDTLGTAGASGRGDAGDFFPGSKSVRAFSDDTNPSARLSGEPSGITIASLTGPGAVMQAALYVSGQFEPAVVDEAGGETPASETYGPDRVLVRVGDTSGDVNALSVTDGRTLSVKAERKRRGYKVNYLVNVRIPRDGNRHPATMALQLRAARGMTARLKAYNASRSSWSRLGRRRVSRSAEVGVQPGSEFVDNEGTVTIRVTYRSAKSFVHELDQVSLQLD